MNAVEIEEAVSNLVMEPFDAAIFPFRFLEAFGNKETTIKRLKSGNSNLSDVPGGILQRNNIHLLVCPKGETAKALDALRASPATKRQKAKFALVTDGEMFEAENLVTGEAVACAHAEFADHFGLFLPLAGISTVTEIENNPIDIRATGRLNKLYLELLKENPDWEKAERRHDLNQLMARLIFCFFAEDTGIFHGEQLFTRTVEQMSDGSNAHEVIVELFRAMDMPLKDRQGNEVKSWANAFPYVNGGLFTGTREVPRFSKMARAYLLQAGRLDWKQINPDIFGSMIQAIAEDEERGELGMHYTSVPNILKVLNPLFLDDLRTQLEAARENPRMLLNLRRRMSRIRVFDPACGSGNFLVIAYKEVRAIEAEINKRRKETGRGSDIPLTNFRGIEIRDFAAEVARLALIIAEYQCDVFYRGQREALLEFLPLNRENWITCGNALRLGWLSICPPTGIGVKFQSDDLFQTPLDQAQIDFENEGGETYICGNPPYLGSKWQSKEQKEELKAIFDGRVSGWKSLDYVAGWLLKAADFGISTKSSAAFVTTNSINQGQQVPILWPAIFKTGHEICFAHLSFKWSNLASKNAGVTVTIVGIAKYHSGKRHIYWIENGNESVVREVAHINAYLVPGSNSIVEPCRNPATGAAKMLFGNMPRDGGHFVLSADERKEVLEVDPKLERFIRPYLGSEQMIQGKPRWCFWIDDGDLKEASSHARLRKVMDQVRAFRSASAAGSTRDFAQRPHRFVQIAGTAKRHSLAVAKVSSERREYIPVDLIDNRTIVSDLLFALYDAPIWNMAVIASRLHLVWIANVCGKLKTDYRYSNTLGWNTFPLPKLTEKNKDDLTKCAADILLAREAHFPATIADLYSPDQMPDDLRAAHYYNDEVLERIFIGRRFRNDTERLEKLFEYYSKITSLGPSK